MLQLSTSFADPGDCQPAIAQWDILPLASSSFIEFIPGRDNLWQSSALAAGLIPYLELHSLIFHAHFPEDMVKLQL